MTRASVEPVGRRALPSGAEQIIVGLAISAERRELPPDDLELPSEDVLTRMTNDYRSASSQSGWSKIVPQS